MSNSASSAELFDSYRPLLFSIAYRMLGSAADAEDAVQEAFLRWLQASPAEIGSPKAYLSTVVVRLCIDQLRSSKAQREIYVGPWLPEPIFTAGQPELVETAILAESLQFAFLVMLENLAPLERAVFLLREVFGYSYPEIAGVVGKSEANCRQVLHRAQLRLSDRRPRFNVSRTEQELITNQFMRASTDGDMQGLLNLLTSDIVLIGDGGGKAQTARNPVYGADKVVRGMLGGLSRVLTGLEAFVAEVNGQPAILGYVNGRLFGVVLLHIEDGLVQQVYMIVNPDKLHRLEEQIGSPPAG